MQTTVDSVERAAFFDRILAPRDGPAVAPVTSTSDRNQQRAAEAAEFHRKGLVFALQGAWREAETAFRDAERRNDKVPEYKLSAAYAYLRTHKPNDAYKRFEEFYKKDPSDVRALVGMIAAREDAQLYRDAVALWVRYTRMPLPEAEAREAQALLRGARELFAQRYEIAENPAGGAANLATPAQELEWGLGYARELSESGIPLLADPAIVSYVEQLSERLVKHSKQFPTNYRLFVLDTAGVNATTVPGFIFVYRGLLDAASSEAALAGVLAHEIGHSVRATRGTC
jgi:tetratricopeptide (TPR) repeat protein